MTRYWLFKTEPNEYRIDDLKKDRQTAWTGIRNYQVRNMLRDEVAAGDMVIIYHSSVKMPAAVGEGIVIKTSYPDPTQFDPDSEYFDPGSKAVDPRWLSVDIKFKDKFKTEISLDQLRQAKTFQTSPLVRKGNRLSIVPLNRSQYDLLIAKAKT